MEKLIRINEVDTVAVALQDVKKGDTYSGVVAAQDIPQGHKMALCGIKKGDSIVKYGFPIGHATNDILPGEHVHVHNVKTNLSEDAEYKYNPKKIDFKMQQPQTFNGFKRKDGNAGVRNEIWILPTVGCVNGVVQKLCSDNAHLVKGSIDGLYSFPHPFGCSQMGDDHAQTRRLLASLAKHPNAGGVLVVSLGCENLTHEQFLEELGEYDKDRIKFMVCQDVDDEYEQGAKLLEEIAKYAGEFKREPIDVSSLIIGMKCGGSDGLSGVSANPVVGSFSDILCSQGGSTILTEVPEMFGAEDMIMERCESKEVFDKTVKMVQDFKDYFTAHNQVVYENPSPGNKQGGITTLEDKSCGCVQKGGNAPVVDVVDYGCRITKKGLNLLSGPGNDLVSATALTASGAQIILFTTGRGTPFGAPAPTLKISTNSQLAQRKQGWIDFDTGSVARGEKISDVAQKLFDKVISTANGEQTNSEKYGFREISIFKGGVVL